MRVRVRLRVRVRVRVRVRAAHALEAAEHGHAATRQPPQPAPRLGAAGRVERRADAEQAQVRGHAPLPVVLLEQLPGKG